MALTISVLFISFFVLLAIGTPISIGIGLASFLTILINLPFDVAVIASAQKMITGMDSFTLLAIPFFILSGSIMNTGGIAIKLVNFAKLLGGRLPGSLAQVNVLGNMLFGSISGSAVAAAAAIGGTLDPLQKKEGYDPKFSAAVNIASSPTGLLIPPSGSLIVFSLVSGGTSIGALFVAGYIPGILMGLSVMIIAYFIAKKNNYPVEGKVSFGEATKIILDAIPSLLLIVIVIGGIIAGIFTATEASAISVVYTLFLSVVVYKSLTFEHMQTIFKDTVKMTGIIMFLIGASSIMSWAMAFSTIPQFITNAILGLSDNKIIILLLMNVILLITGTFMDLTPAILIFTPIFLPIATKLGLHPVHFGIMLVSNLCIGICTPPVGSVLFIGCGIAKVKIEEVIKELIPFFIGLIITLLMITYIPWISLGLPKLFKLL
ncbi:MULTISPECIES: TRAP transporter large permease [Cetobacterium]|uniref:TRAP transporter large permease n=1 Tax=Cetobacterium TaxID=180162 RepID=UPI00163BAC41|nr:MULTISPECIES: TRAP transporter large permease [Cetobacterium]MBC2852497.1 TRAP transporter large permease [Cetobacterium sp. 2G large]